MIIAGNSHVTLFRGRLRNRANDSIVSVRWVGALTADHFLNNHSAARAIQAAFASTDGWKILSIGMHDIFGLCRAYSQNVYRQACNQLLKRYQDLFGTFGQAGRFAWLISPQQLEGTATASLSPGKVFEISEEFNHLTTKWCRQRHIAVINPLKALRRPDGTLNAKFVQQDGIHLNDQALAPYVKELKAQTGLDLAIETLPASACHRVKARNEPESLALLIADELQLGWDHSKWPYGERQDFEDDLIAHVQRGFDQKGQSVTLDRTTCYNADNALNSADLVSLYNHATDCLGVELAFDVNIRELNTVEKIADFLLARKPLSKNDFYETLSRDSGNALRQSETFIADRKLAALDEERYSRLREIIHHLTGGAPCQYGVVYFWIALIEAERGNYGWACQLLALAESPHISFPLCSSRVSFYRQLWHAKSCPPPPDTSAADRKAPLATVYADDLHDLVSHWSRQVESLRSTIGHLYVVAADDGTQRLLEMFPRLQTVDLFVPPAARHRQMAERYRHDPRVRVWPFMLSDRTGHELISYAEQKGNHRVSAGAPNTAWPADILSTETVTWADFLDTHAAEPPDLLICSVPGLSERLCDAIPAAVMENLKAACLATSRLVAHLPAAQTPADSKPAARPFDLFGLVRSSGLQRQAVTALYINPRSASTVYQNQRILDRLMASAAAGAPLLTTQNTVPAEFDECAAGLTEELYGLGRRLQKDQKSEDALFVFNQVMDTDPHHADALYQIGALLNRAGKVSKALPYWEAAFNQRPSDRMMALAYAQALWSSGRQEQAQAVCRRYAARNWRLDDRCDDLLADIAYPHGLPNEDESAALHNVRSLADQGQLGQAYQALSEWVAEHPDRAQGHNDLGVLACRRGDDEKALNHYARAVELEPHNRTYQKNLADFRLARQGDVEAALRTYTALLADDPRDTEVLYALAQICRQVGNADDAQEFLARILDIDPDHGAAREALTAIRDDAPGCHRLEADAASRPPVAPVSAPAPVLIATSIAPHSLEIQQKAVKSWKDLGFDVVSLNSPEEIAGLKDSFPDIAFHAVDRTSQAHFGKPYIYFDDVIAHFKGVDRPVYGIVNSDIHLKADDNILAFLQAEANQSLLFGHRLDVTSLSSSQGDFYRNGYDFFFFDRSLLGLYPDSILSLGVTWWDYWTVLIPALNGFPVKKLVSPLAYHLEHPNRWDRKQWIHVGRLISAYLKAEDIDQGRTWPADSPWLLFREILQNGAAVKCLQKPFQDRTRRRFAYGDNFTLNICILDFIEQICQKVTLPWDDELIHHGDTTKGPNFSPDFFDAHHLPTPKTVPPPLMQDCALRTHQAQRLYREGRGPEAQAILESIIHEIPGHPPACNLLGAMAWEAGSTDTALRHFHNALRYNPYDRPTIINCSAALARVGRPEESRQIYAAYLRFNPGDIEIGRWCRRLEAGQNLQPPDQFTLHQPGDLSLLPILIYQMGKVGSTSLVDSIAKLGLPVKHVHTLSWPGILHAEKAFRDETKRELPSWLTHYRGIRTHIDRLGQSAHWKIITLVRDPLKRYISDLFQNLDRYFPHLNDLPNEDPAPIREHILRYLEEFDEAQDHACSWFDKELLGVFGVDLLASPFNTAKGYQRYQTKHADILLIRLEDLESCAAEAMADFLAIDTFQLAHSNVSATKPYAALYRRLNDELRFDRSLLDRFYSSRLAQHFYTASEIEAFKAQWCSQPSMQDAVVSQTPPRVSAVVSTYASARFIEGRLQNLVDQTLFQKGGLEIIVIDSSSPEDEGAIVERFAARHPNIFYLRTDERETVYTAWNRGIEMARGTYFVNANTDDRFSTNALERMADALDSHCEYDAVYGNWVVTRIPNDSFDSDAPKRLFIYPEFDPGLFFYLQITSHANFVRRSVFDSIGGFDGSYTVFGDREFMLRFSASGHKAMKLETIVGLYLENPTSVERANKEIGLQECRALYDHYLEADRFATLMGFGKGTSPAILSKEYTRIGCLGMGLYDIDGKSLHALGSPARLFAKAIELNPENVIALNNLGVVAQCQGAPEEACQFLKQARSLAGPEQRAVIDSNQDLAAKKISDPNRLQFLFPRAFTPIRVSETSYPVDRRLSPRPAVPSSVSGASRKRTPQSRKQIRKQNRSQKPELAPDLARRPDDEIVVPQPATESAPWQACLRGDYAAAASLLRRNIASHIEDWEAYALLVDVLLQSGQEAAIVEQLHPLESRPDLPAGMRALIGSGYEAAGDLKMAADFAEQALAADPDCARAWNLKGVLAFRSGDKQAAEAHFKTAAGKDAAWGEPWTNMGTVYWEQRDRENALACFEKGFRLSPAAPNVATTYHVAVSETGEFERARALFEDVVTRYPDFRRARFLLIDILIRREAFPDALERIETVMVDFGVDAQLLQAARAVRAKVGPMTVKKRKRPSLSLCMIVKNEERYLARCLQSLKPLVDEMIIVDTGSSDATRDIAEVFGARVFDFEWDDDFAAARNHSLEKAVGDWILVMDADEVIAPRDHAKIRRLIAQSKTRQHAYMLTTRNYTDRRDSVDYRENAGEYDEEMSTGWVPSRKVRLFPNRQHIHFVFPVHEQVDPVLAERGTALVTCPVPVHHYGKLDHDRTDKRWALYYAIGKQKLDSLGENESALKELAIQAALLSKWEEAATYWKRYLDLKPESVEACLNLTRVMAAKGNHAEALQYARLAFQLDADRLETHYNLTLSHLQAGEAAQAIQTSRQMTAAFPGDPDGRLLQAAATLCAGQLSQGRQLALDLAHEIPAKTLKSRILTLMAAIASAGLMDWITRLVDALSQIDGLHDIGAQLNAMGPQSVAPSPKSPPLDNQQTGVLLDEAWHSYVHGDFQAAVDNLVSIIVANPDQWEAYALLVDVLLQSGQEAAIVEQLHPLESRPDLPAGMRALIGSGYEAAGDLKMAADFAEQALAADPDCARAWNLKGVLAFRSGDKQAAEAHFKTAAGKDAAWGEPWTNMGTVYWEQRDRENALACFEKGFRLSPAAPNVATTYHVAVSETGEFERARALFEDVVTRYPDFRRARFLLIDILIRREAFPDALERIETVMVDFGVDAQLLQAARAVRAKVGPMTVKKRKRPSLSLCMIVKNEERYLARCLQSLKPLVDEMIIVDTGSSDATRDIAEVFGARVFDFEWDDDFAAARNHSLEKAVGDWILVMDADEVIAPRDHAKIRRLIAQSKTRQHAYMIVTRNYTNRHNIIGWEANVGEYSREESGLGWTPSPKVRLFPNLARIRFEYPVHEVLGPALSRNGISVKACSCPVHHYGKLDERLDRRKDEHYYQIGMRKLSDAGDDPVAIRELAVQAGRLEKHEDALRLWKRFVTLQPEDAKGYINMASSHGKLGQFDKAREAARIAVRLAPRLKEGYLNLGLSEFHSGNLVKAEHIFSEIVKQHGNYYSAVFLYGVTQLGRKKINEGVKTLRSLEGTAIIWDHLSYAIQELVESLMKSGLTGIARQLIIGAEKLERTNDYLKGYHRQLEMEAA